MPTSPFSLYVHVPYCRTKCLYCDFNSYATRATPWQEYLETLTLELSAYRAHPFWGRPLKTLFFGGGTPSLFPPAFFEALLPRLFEAFPPEPDLELTVECNPGTVTLERLTGYRALGINRLSFGVQSLNPEHLKTLTRIHGPEEAKEAVWMAQAAGFEDVSIDLMFGVPGQTVEGWEAELLEALTLPLSHISVYNLTPEEGTALLKLLERGRLHLPDEAYLVTMYQRTREILRAHGFTPYEISNFSRLKPCHHNLQYWTGGDYLGLGAGAHSYARAPILPGKPDVEATPGTAVPGYSPQPWTIEGEGGCRWSVLEDPRAHQEACAAGRLPIDWHEGLTRRQFASELLLTRGRIMQGLDLEDLDARFGDPRGTSLRSAVLERAAPYLSRGLMKLELPYLALTDEGVLLADGMIRALSEALEDALERLERRSRRHGRGDTEASTP